MQIMHLRVDFWIIIRNLQMCTPPQKKEKKRKIFANEYFPIFLFLFLNICKCVFHASADWAGSGQPAGHIAPRWQIRPNQKIWEIQKYFDFHFLFVIGFSYVPSLVIIHNATENGQRTTKAS